MDTTARVVTAYQQAMAQGDFAAARKLLADDLVFKGPFDTFTEPESYLAALKRLLPIVKGVSTRKLFVDGDDACLLYDMETNIAAGTVLIAEWFHVRDGRIASVQAVFDARPFAPLFSK